MPDILSKIPEFSWPIAFAIVHPNVGGILGGFITRKNINPWYQSLKRPNWTPPNWLFGPVWTSIYSSLGYASYLVYRDIPSIDNSSILPLTLYATNLALNWSWTPIFFGLHKIDWALYNIMALWINTATLGFVYYKINHTAGLLIIPYVAWNTLATALNYVVYRDNKNDLSIEEIKEE
ncbi:hypothetical protein HCN44_007365 [Aphidius gifuensis]|uniref:Translocator protein n=1 Tax=Aphidius gifuensis TaxID=684658 RepID=A0A834XLC6_APHGI|nr:translocator protein [Aphidius gifuensis]XP_044015197.1 translocator protein [Aphidius gifuensis]KAF7989055.1 hypothetical protein HCN44_007365 [Aphidius gifuensis]